MAEKEKTKGVLYTKEQLKKSNEFAKYKDILTVVIKDEEKITKAECSKRIDAFLKREVK